MHEAVMIVLLVIALKFWLQKVQFVFLLNKTVYFNQVSSRSSSELEECSSSPQGVSGSLASFCLLHFNHCSRTLMSTQSKGFLGRCEKDE